MSDSNDTGRGELIIYQTETDKTKIEVRLVDGTVWLSQKLIAQLYQVGIPTINEHIKGILDDGELDAAATIRNFRIVQTEGKREVTRDIEFYNLEMILSVGYRVRSHRGAQFRRWATERLNEYLVKGFTMDDERLKQGKNIGTDYFDELLERIRDIRASEKRFYQKIRDIYKLAIDYDPKAEETTQFFKIVQNKLHFAITGKTAAELISERADAEKPNMGLTSWSGPRVHKADVTVAKNYLNKQELDSLNRIVVMYLDYAEDQARRRQQIYMRDWREKLDAFLKFNEREILGNSGRVSKDVADALALGQYEQFNTARLEQEAKEESLTDDEELKKLQDKMEKQQHLKKKDEK